MLFDSTVRKELARTFGATLMVMLTILMTNFVIRALGLAANGAVAAQDVLLVFTFLALGSLPTFLALSLFVSIVITLGRMYRESEMAIWFSSGIGLTRFVRPVVATSWPVVVVIAGLMLVVLPWSNRQQNDLRTRFEQRSDVMRASPGQFQSSADGHRVFFVEKAGAEQVGGGRNVFILNDLGTSESVAVSESGKLETVGADRVLVLGTGHLERTDHATGEHTHTEFRQARVRAGEGGGAPSGEPAPSVLDTAALVRRGGNANMGELAWRVGLVLGSANLLFMGIGLSVANPRRPSNWSLLFAGLAFLSYYNVLNLSRAWVSSGRVNVVVALVATHGLGFCVGLALLWWRDHATVVHPLRLLTRRSAA